MVRQRTKSGKQSSRKDERTAHSLPRGVNRAAPALRTTQGALNGVRIHCSMITQMVLSLRAHPLGRRWNQKNHCHNHLHSETWAAPPIWVESRNIATPCAEVLWARKQNHPRRHHQNPNPLEILPRLPRNKKSPPFLLLPPRSHQRLRTLNLP